MKKHSLLIALLLTACASGAPNDPNVTIHLAQLETGSNAFLYGGAVQIGYALTVTNGTNEKLTLNRIEIRTVSSGAYTIRPTSMPINAGIDPGQSKTMSISIWGTARGGYLSATEPVTLRAVGYFAGPSGPFVRLFTEYLTQQ